MDNIKKIEILKKRIEILEQENQQLKYENSRLNDQLYLNTNVGRESVDATNELLETLKNKELEFDNLIQECKLIKENYVCVSNEMQELMRKYKKDISSSTIKQLFDEIRYKFVLG